MPGVQKLNDGVAADKAGAAGYQNFHSKQSFRYISVLKLFLRLCGRGGTVAALARSAVAAFTRTAAHTVAGATTHTALAHPFTREGSAVIDEKHNALWSFLLALLSGISLSGFVDLGAYFLFKRLYLLARGLLVYSERHGSLTVSHSLATHTLTLLTRLRGRSLRSLFSLYARLVAILFCNVLSNSRKRHNCAANRDYEFFHVTLRFLLFFYCFKCASHLRKSDDIIPFFDGRKYP
jgi:hypothetical protein